MLPKRYTLCAAWFTVSTAYGLLHWDESLDLTAINYKSFTETQLSEGPAARKLIPVAELHGIHFLERRTSGDMFSGNDHYDVKSPGTLIRNIHPPPISSNTDSQTATGRKLSQGSYGLSKDKSFMTSNFDEHNDLIYFAYEAGDENSTLEMRQWARLGAAVSDVSDGLYQRASASNATDCEKFFLFAYSSALARTKIGDAFHEAFSMWSADRDRPIPSFRQIMVRFFCGRGCADGTSS